MLSLRSLARAAPRSAARYSAKAVRPQASLFRPTAAVQPAFSHAVPRLAAAFSLSTARRQENSSNEELVAKLQSEIAMESEMKESDDLSANIKEYLENSPFEIEDVAGTQEVVLTRTFGDEKIRITFSTADLNNDMSEELSDDQAIYDDADMDLQSGGANSKGATTQGRTQDGNVRVANEGSEELDEEFEEGTDQGFPARASINIERPGKGALAIEATAQDGDFVIEDMFYFPKADLADPKTAEKDWERRALYTGPPFNNLDEDLQILLEKYLEERGINTRLALFIPDYIDHKEQKEYVRWLDNVRQFVE